MNILHTFTRVTSARASFSSLHPLARLILTLLALPGLILILLSLLALLVSILALSLLTVPAYRLFRAMAGGPVPQPQGDVVSTDGEEVTVEPAQPAPESPPRRHIDVKIIE
jgi:hypothetical protein